MKFTTSTPTIENCTIANNQSSVCAGGIVAVNDVVTIRNSIVYGNTPEALCTIQAGSFDVSFSNIEGGFEGNGNIDSNPLFCNVSGGDFTLAENSPCAGTDNSGGDMGAFGVNCEAVSYTHLTLPTKA